MKIALIGASGFIGSAVLEEALMRGHEVSAIVSNPMKLTGTDRLTIKKADARQTAVLAEQLKGHDVVVSAFSGHGSDDVYGYYMEGFRSIVAAARQAAANRLIMVGGAGSLEIQSGVLLIDSPAFPEQWRETAQGAKDALDELRKETGLEWTVVTPAASTMPGSRTGQYRVGSDQVMSATGGEISVEDYAVAMLDEIEAPTHVGRRFTVAY